MICDVNRNLILSLLPIRPLLFCQPAFFSCYYIPQVADVRMFAVIAAILLRNLYAARGNIYVQRSAAECRRWIRRQRRGAYWSGFFLGWCFGYDIKWLKEFASEIIRNGRDKFYCMMFRQANGRSDRALKIAGCGEENRRSSWDEMSGKGIFHEMFLMTSWLTPWNPIKKADINFSDGDILRISGAKEEQILKSAQIYSEIPAKPLVSVYLNIFRKRNDERAIERGGFAEEDHEKILDGYYGKYLSIDAAMTGKPIFNIYFCFYWFAYYRKAP